MDEIPSREPQVHSAVAQQTQSTHFPNGSYFKSWRKDSSFSILTLAPVSQLEPFVKSLFPCPRLCLLLCDGGCTPHARHRGHPQPLCPTHTLELEPVPSWLLKDYSSVSSFSPPLSVLSLLKIPTKVLYCFLSNISCPHFPTQLLAISSIPLQQNVQRSCSHSLSPLLFFTLSTHQSGLFPPLFHKNSSYPSGQ